MKKRLALEKKFSFSNRVLYSLITLGILSILAVGVYAVDTTQGWHDANQIDFSNGFTVGDGMTSANIVVPFGGMCLDSDGACNSPGDGGLRVGAYGIDASDDASYINMMDAVNMNGNQLCMSGTDCISSWSDVDGRWFRQGGSSNHIYYMLGNVGIGMNTPGDENYDLNVGGAVIATEYYYSSDRALKENIHPLQNSLSAVEQLEGVSFNWKENGEASIGFIAQDVEKVLPELVSGEEGRKSIAYANIVAVLTEAIKEQQKQIEELQREVEELRSH